MSIRNIMGLVNTTMPFAWDNSMSVYEMLGKLISKINEVVDEVNLKLPDDFEKVFYERFREYTKDEMQRILDSGEFAAILDSMIVEFLPIKQEVIEARGTEPTLGARLAQTIKVANVKHFGAKGDGVTNDTLAFQSAIDSLEQGGTVYIPVGSYILNDLTIERSNVHILGEGMNTLLLATNLSSSFISVDQGGVSGTTMYGDSLVNIQFRNLLIRANYTQTLDPYNNPLTWYPHTAIYLNGARNQSLIKDVRIEGFETGVYMLFNWMCNVDGLYTQLCKNGLYLDQECNNITIQNSIFRRAGSISDYTGFAVRIKYSYSVTLITNNLESSNCEGFVYEGSHSITHIGGDIENNDNEVRKIIIRGYDGFETNPNKISRAIVIMGVRFRHSLGIRIEKGSRHINILGCSFYSRSVQTNGYGAIQIPDKSVTDVNVDNTNDIFGLTNPELAIHTHVLVGDKKTELINKYHVIDSLITIEYVDAQVIGYFPERSVINKIQLYSPENQLADSIKVDIGVNNDVGLIKANEPFSTFTDIGKTPFGVKEVTGFNAVVDKGNVIARVKDSTITGKIGVRIFYTLTW